MTDDGRRGHARRGVRSAALVSLMAYGGLRPSEAMGAKVGHLDREAVGIWVSDVMSAEHRIDHTKTGDWRFARLPSVVLDDLECWIQFASLDDSSGWLFPDREGSVTPCTYPNWVHEIRRARGEISVRKPEWRTEFATLTPKTFRHTCASLRLRAGDPVAEIAADLGHSPEILVRWYSHEVRASRDAPVQPLELQIAHARAEFATSLAARRLANRQRATRRRSRLQRTAPAAPAGALRLIGNRYAWDVHTDRLRRS